MVYFTSSMICCLSEVLPRLVCQSMNAAEVIQAGAACFSEGVGARNVW